ncbi:hypothetical protein L596_001606 [Steinernema carpocapsae]|uniref:Uncharacterized protein n=1 Tax=Steinernema carpocapsae TaxID=34508 RepID=A0A4U8ULI9_STECR|nr:hypothetical protein L596_001606 [Steinernema carpocapsae]
MRVIFALLLFSLPLCCSAILGVDFLVSIFSFFTGRFVDHGDLQVQQEWKNYVTKHQKSYANEGEEQMRFAIFKRNSGLAQERAEREEGTAKFGPNIFSDMTEEEFVKTILMDPHLLQATKPNATRDISDEDDEDPLPNSFDWREHKAVTEVKDQGNCGSCWAFSTTGNVESVWAVKKKQLVSLSEQQILDCEKSFLGCMGGWPSAALEHVMKWGGLEPEEDYKYHGQGLFCRMNKSDLTAHIDGYTVLSKDEDAIARYLMKHGSISVAMNARSSLMHYTEGIIKLSEKNCNHHSDHAVLLVGFGIENEMPYWIVKNSWGSKWGEDGYFRIFRGGNVCAIADSAVSAFLN